MYTEFIEDQTPFEHFNNMEMKRYVSWMLSTLSPREEYTLRSRIFQDKTFIEIGRDLGVGLERARQIYLKGLRKLRHPTRSKGGRSFYKEIDEEPRLAYIYMEQRRGMYTTKY